MPDSANLPVVLFDLDGTLIDSAPGIVAAMQQAMAEVGMAPAAEDVLRSDLGPPPGVVFAALGMPAELIEPARLAYRRHYRSEGIANATVYPGVVDLLNRLAPRYRLATATMKLIDTATQMLAEHDLGHYFELVGGAADRSDDKPAIIAATRTGLGDPPADRMIMVGDRHSDIAGGRQHGLPTIAVGWGYGTRAELVAAAPDAIVDRPADLPAVLDRLLNR